MARGVAEDGVLIADILLGVLAVLVIRGHSFRYSRVIDLDIDLVMGVVTTEPGVSSVAVVHSQAQGLVLIADLANQRR